MTDPRSKPTFEMYFAACTYVLSTTDTPTDEVYVSVLASQRPDLAAALPASADPRHEPLERFLRWLLDNWY